MENDGHDCMYGVGPEYGGGLRWYTEVTRFHMNSGKDTEFDYCPICGKKLEWEEEDETTL